MGGQCSFPGPFQDGERRQISWPWVAVSCDYQAGIKAIPIPREIAEKIEEAHHREGD